MAMSPQSRGGASYSDGDNESMPLRGQSMDDKMDVMTRHGFIRKVFGIVGLQLLVTIGIAYPFAAYPEQAKMMVMQYQGLLILAMMMPMILMCYSMCQPHIMREYPKNYVFLSIYTLCFGVIVGMSCFGKDTKTIFLAVGITAAIVISLTAFAMQTSYDFSGSGPYLMCAFFCMFLTSLMLMFASSFSGGAGFKTAHMVMSGLFAILFSFYIVYDVQLISGGKHQQMRFGLDEYAFAALVLYMDIINLFLHILSLLGDRRN